MNRSKEMIKSFLFVGALFAVLFAVRNFHYAGGYVNIDDKSKRRKCGIRTCRK